MKNNFSFSGYFEKYPIFAEKKTLKQNARKSFHRHYPLLAFLILVTIFFGTEFRQAANGISGYTILGNGFMQDFINDRQQVLLHEMTIETPLGAGDVFSYFATGHFMKGLTASQELEKLVKEKIKDKAVDSSFFGRSRGELAKLVNTIYSGKLFTKLAQTVFSITHSDRAVSIVFTIGSFLWYALLFFLLKNVFSAVIRRVFLLSRTYERVSYMETLHLLSVRRWGKACVSMALQYIYLLLWGLTVVGYFIKQYSYFAVPFIIAENPDVDPREAILLSRRMMDGHKLELFFFQITFAGWHILSIVTVGFSDMVYGAAWRMANYTEFYVRVRELALQKGIAGTELLNDPYLYAKADRIQLFETYFDVVDEITLLEEQKVTLTPAQQKVSGWFGIWIGSLALKKQYDDLEGRRYAIRSAKYSMDGVVYPHRLNPLYRKTEKKARLFSFMRSYSVWTLGILFLALSMMGWSWEVALHFMQRGTYANRGLLHGPWLPIYGTGGIVVLVLLHRLKKNPVAMFFASILLCGGIEYLTGAMLEAAFHRRWWSYDGYFLNIQGRVCAEGLLVFGIAALLIVYLVAPIMDSLLSRVPPQILIAASVVLGCLFVADVTYSRKHPNLSKGAVSRQRAEPVKAEEKEKAAGAESTEPAVPGTGSNAAEAASTAEAAGKAEAAGAAEAVGKAEAAGKVDAGGKAEAAGRAERFVTERQ